MKQNEFENPSAEPAIIAAAKEKKDFLYSQGGEKMVKAHGEIYDLADELEKKYPDARKYYLFHVMISSTIDRDACPKFDFPGDDSIAKSLDNLYREYKAE